MRAEPEQKNVLFFIARGLASYCSFFFTFNALLIYSLSCHQDEKQLLLKVSTEMKNNLDDANYIIDLAKAKDGKGRLLYGWFDDVFKVIVSVVVIVVIVAVMVNFPVITAITTGVGFNGIATSIGMNAIAGYLGGNVYCGINRCRTACDKGPSYGTWVDKVGRCANFWE